MAINKKELLEQQFQIKLELLKRKAQKEFYVFCKAKAPKFYKKDREYLKVLAETLQKVYDGKLINQDTGKPYKKLMLNLPPRFGKSSTTTLFISWILGNNPENRIISISYNEKLSSRFGKQTRDHIDEKKLNPEAIVYNDLFPDTKIKYGDSSKQIWSLEGQFFNYLASSPTGTMTGIGANIGIIDDLIKTSEESFNDNILNDHWDWYTNTFLSRLEAGSIQILIGTRWNTKDLFGRLLEIERDQWYVLEFEAYDQNTDKMLCSEIMDFEDYQNKKKLINNAIFQANWHQKPVDIEGRLYKNFKTYTPEDIAKIKFEKIIAPVDTADRGKDYFVTGAVGVYKGQGYVLDILFTRDPMEVTEPKTAKLFFDNKVTLARVESQAGGEGFKRAVDRLLWEIYQTRNIKIETFAQKSNKLARIRDKSTFVQENIYFPLNWQSNYLEFFNHVSSFQGSGKDQNDDGADWLTMVAEMIEKTKDRFAGYV